MSSSTHEVTLREVTRETLSAILRLQVAPHQQHCVAPNAVSIAEAHFAPPEVAWFRAIYAADTPVGFVMLEDLAARQEYFLWRFMIDQHYQGKGYGRQAIELLCAYVKTRPGADVLYTSCVQGEASPGPFYEKLGFIYTGAQEEDELIMRRQL